MKATKKYITLLLIFCLITCSLFSINVMASFNDDSDDYSEEFQPMMAMTCDEYGNPNWSSLDDAMNYYGNDYEYSELDEPITIGDKTYTHYYTFSDGSRMYFGVSG